MTIRRLNRFLPLAVLFAPLALQATGYDQAVRRMEQGDYRGAIPLWDQWLSSHAADAGAWLQRGEAYLALGFNPDAIGDLETALHQAEAAGSDSSLAAVRIALGRAYYQDQRWLAALDQLRRGTDLADRLGRPDLVGAGANLLGNLALAQGDRALAERYYRQGEAAARLAGDVALTAGLKLNRARIEEDSRQAAALLQQVYEGAGEIPQPLERAVVLRATGYEALQLGRMRLAYQALSQTVSIARTLGQERLLSEGLGYLGNLYERQGKHAEALGRTAEAILVARGISAPDLLLRWEWQQGRLQRDAEEPAAALASYRRAVAHIQSIRGDIPVQYRDGRSSFRETLAPVYLGLVELLLDQSRLETDPAAAQALLAEAQDTVELLKTAELRDYFADACAVVQAPLLKLEGAAQGTAVLYPIILPDRLDLLAQIGATKYLHQVPMSEAELQAKTARLIRGLRPTSAGRLHPFAKALAEQLYRVLIGPFEAQLDAARVHTLVFVPDGVLRNLPLGVLWDGDRYLIERYAVATVPGLTLLDPKPLPRTGITALLSGLSRPGEVVDKLPEDMRRALQMGAKDVEPAAGTRRIAVRALPSTVPAAASDATAADTPTDRRRLQQALALPGVVRELEQLSQILPSARLLDEEFRLGRFEREMQKSYRIVHIASHGIFSGDPEQSFIITYDKVLNMDRLGELFQSDLYSSAPVEILALSACQTAEGDDRSPLGLSGVALRSGARSALGSLWPVSDEAAQILLPDFYRNLQEPEVTKAQALQRAQIDLLRREGFAHPSFWSAFVLIGNWF